MTDFSFLMVVEDPRIARFVSEHGVDRVFVDLEIHGKHERQKDLASWKSRSTLDDVHEIRSAVPDANLLVRVNPIHEDSPGEIDQVVAAGADRIMLPMFRTIDEVARFHALVAGRAITVPLFETVESLSIISEAASRGLLDEAHIGLNDLHLDRGDVFMFQPLVDGTLEEPCAVLRKHRIPFGIGGLARAGEGIVSPDFLLGEHVRLGSSAAILSRTFHRSAENVEQLASDMDFAGEVEKLRQLYRNFRSASESELAENRIMTADRVRDVVHLIEAKKREATAS